MSINGKRDEFEREDLIALSNVAGIKRDRANKMVDHVIETIRRWPDFAEEAGVANARVEKIQASQRTNL